MSSAALTRVMTLFYVALFFAYLFGPLVLMGISAFNTEKYPTAVPWSGFTLEWFNKLFNDTDLVRGFQNSLIIGAGVVVLSVPIGLAAAIIMSQLHKRARSIYYAVVLSPMLTPGVIIGISTLVFWD
ncbi:MAG: ABC transporter permease, partial [Hyphomicrobiales bacterium]|nr:ABC transporter permease [Hyphomicrobiales bacterium]